MNILERMSQMNKVVRERGTVWTSIGQVAEELKRRLNKIKTQEMVEDEKKEELVEKIVVTEVDQ